MYSRCRSGGKGARRTSKSEVRCSLGVLVADQLGERMKEGGSESESSLIWGLHSKMIMSNSERSDIKDKKVVIELGRAGTILPAQGGAI